LTMRRFISMGHTAIPRMAANTPVSSTADNNFSPTNDCALHIPRRKRIEMRRDPSIELMKTVAARTCAFSAEPSAPSTSDISILNMHPSLSSIAMQAGQCSSGIHHQQSMGIAAHKRPISASDSVQFSEKAVLQQEAIAKATKRLLDLQHAYWTDPKVVQLLSKPACKTGAVTRRVVQRKIREVVAEVVEQLEVIRKALSALRDLEHNAVMVIDDACGCLALPLTQRIDLGHGVGLLEEGTRKEQKALDCLLVKKMCKAADRKVKALRKELDDARIRSQECEGDLAVRLEEELVQLCNKRRMIAAVKRHYDKVKPVALHSLSDAIDCCRRFEVLDSTVESISGKALVGIAELLGDSALASPESSGSDFGSESDSGSDSDSESDSDFDSHSADGSVGVELAPSCDSCASPAPALSFCSPPLLDQLSQVGHAWKEDGKLHRCSFELMGDTSRCTLLNKMQETQWSKMHI